MLRLSYHASGNENVFRASVFYGPVNTRCTVGFCVSGCARDDRHVRSNAAKQNISVKLAYLTCEDTRSTRGSLQQQQQDSLRWSSRARKHRIGGGGQASTLVSSPTTPLRTNLGEVLLNPRVSLGVHPPGFVETRLTPANLEEFPGQLPVSMALVIHTQRCGNTNCSTYKCLSTSANKGFRIHVVG